jgi:hypothetical protein
MAITIAGGWLQGNLIRKARVLAHCDNWRHCPDQTIHPGQFYAEYELDPDSAGGFGMKKVCMVCAGDEARATLASVQGGPVAG